MAGDRLSLLTGLLDKFAIYGEFESAEPFGSGHINATFRSRWNQAGVPVRYLHQRINEKVFLRPHEVMENIQRVTAHITEKLRGAPGWSRRTLTLVPGRDGKPWVRDAEGGWWRTYLFIEGTHSQEVVSSPGEAAFLGKSIGHFQKQLADLGGERLHEAIPDFHNMEYRYRRFYEALARDTANRAGEIPEEIAFMRENEDRGCILIRALRDGSIPERICHNDTKLNNILIDDVDSEALCVGDLDTVMPGTILFDTGDLIRTVTTRAEEDERDLSRVVFDPELFKFLMEGYLSEAAEFLTGEERGLLAESGRTITQIMGLRFLTDYLEGDQYYHIDRPGHNLDRCRNQIALIRSMDSRWGEAERIINKLDFSGSAGAS
ncbi:MdsC protein [Treponema primitia ZAS-2]|uniref:MdsC protein n=1 Tax=Treponema primitia (strain ATCC BAA-887 / DSM 12427 / ZAS-2) TaxID=545694 RepID=F5YP46_TREPZ|nr:phosphotransferase [Treponema primitia]AEF84335.1 MdsC protein [Treponema primitia ZAS-2]